MFNRKLNGTARLKSDFIERVAKENEIIKITEQSWSRADKELKHALNLNWRTDNNSIDSLRWHLESNVTVTRLDIRSKGDVAKNRVEQLFTRKVFV